MRRTAWYRGVVVIALWNQMLRYLTKTKWDHHNFSNLFVYYLLADSYVVVASIWSQYITGRPTNVPYGYLYWRVPARGGPGQPSVLQNTVRVQTILFQQREECSEVPFFSRNCFSMMAPPTFYTTYPTQIYVFQLNVWARSYCVVYVQPYINNSQKISYFVKVKNNDFSRTYAVKVGIFLINNMTMGMYWIEPPWILVYLIQTL